MSKALEAKHEKILKSLLRIPDNKRCMNCDTLGPQYVVGELQIFVCTVCSGVHRQFSHRVKGISMSTFKPEEMKALEAGGNGVGAQVYLAKWRPSELQKPVDRNTTKIKDWIDAVYVKKRFYSAEAASSASRNAATQSQLPRRSISSTSSAGDEVPIVSMGNVLGDGFKLQVVPNPGHFVPNGVNTRAASTASSRSHDSPAPSHVTANLVNILDEPLAPSELKEEPPSEHWDAFGAPAPPQPHIHLPPVQEGPSWAAFEQPGVAVPAIPSQRAPSAPAAPSNNQAASWSAFDFDGQAGQRQASQQQAVQPQQQGPPQQQQQPAGGTARPVQAPPPAEPAKPPARQELPLDLFGDGLLGGYSAPPSITGHYGQQPRPGNYPYAAPGYQQQPNPGYQQQPQPYQQQQAYQQPQPFQQQQGYQQQQQAAAPGRAPSMPFGASFNSFGPTAPSGTAHGGSYGGLNVAPRSNSDATGTGEVSTPDPFSGLVSSLGGALPSVSRHTSTSSSHSVQDMPGRSSFGNIPPVAQPFGMQQTQQAAPGRATSFADPFSSNNGFGQSAQSSNFPPATTEPSRPPAKSSGNPFA